MESLEKVFCHNNLREWIHEILGEGMLRKLESNIISGQVHDILDGRSKWSEWKDGNETLLEMGFGLHRILVLMLLQRSDSTIVWVEESETASMDVLNAGLSLWISSLIQNYHDYWYAAELRRLSCF